MRLSAQEEYGLRCLMQVGLRHRAPEPATIAQIATAEGLSPEYVAKLMRVLRQGGLITSTRGASGGYRLAREPETITLIDVVEVLDGPLFQESLCGSFTGQGTACVHSSTACSIRSVWRQLGGALDAVLRRITIADLVGGPVRTVAPVVVAEVSR